MFYSLLVIALIAALIYVYKRWQGLPENRRQGFAKKAALYIFAGIILGLVVSGRAHWLMGILAALLALAGRVAQLAQYVPLFKKLFGQDSNVGTQQPTTEQAMSRQDAADLLGVDINASEDEVRTAHKRLMQKIHPDRGGSDALAKQINRAKDILIG